MKLCLLCKSRPLPRYFCPCSRPAVILTMIVLLFVHDTPENTGHLPVWEIHQAADLLFCAHGSLTPPRFSPSRPSTEVSLSPSPGHGLRRVQPRHLQWICPAPGRKMLSLKSASFPGSHGESLAGSLEKSRIRMCLMKCIFGCQGAYSSYLTALKLV